MKNNKIYIYYIWLFLFIHSMFFINSYLNAIFLIIKVHYVHSKPLIVIFNIKLKKINI